jgi:uncharacterized protein YpmB
MEIKTIITLGIITTIILAIFFAFAIWFLAKATEKENQGCHHQQIQKNINQRFNKNDHR